MPLLRTLALAVLASTWCLSALAAECEDSVFPLRLTNADNAQEDNFGTAILLDRERWLYVVPAHVIAHSARIFVIRLVELRVLFTDPDDNIALLAPKDVEMMKFWMGLRNRDIAPLELAAGSPSEGEILVCSYPLKSLTAARTRIVPAADLPPSPLDKRGFLRIDKEIFPGESGGAVLDADHRLIGMVVTLLNRERQLVHPGVAIPVEKLQEAVARATERWSEPAPSPAAAEPTPPAITAQESTAVGDTNTAETNPIVMPDDSTTKTPAIRLGELAVEGRPD